MVRHDGSVCMPWLRFQRKKFVNSFAELQKTMSTRIGLNPIYEYRINASKTSVFLFYNDGHEFKALTGELVADVIHQLQVGHLTRDALQEALVDRYEAGAIAAIIAELEEDRFVIELAPDIHADLVAQWSSIDYTPVHLQKALRQTRVEVKAFGVDGASFLQRLSYLGVQCTAGDEADFAVVLTDDVLAPELEGWNSHALHNEMPWILARVVGRKLWFTVFVPQVTACWNAFADSVRRNRDGLLWFDTQDHHLYRASRTPETDRQPAPMGAAHLENLVLHRIFYGEFGPAQGQLFLIDALTGDVDAPRQYARTASRPHCQTSDAVFKPLESRIKQFTDDGGHRTADPKKAFSTYAHLIDPYVGFFRNMSPIDTGRNDLVHVFMMQYSRTAFLTDSADLLRTDTGYSYGKGISEWQSKASCLFEAIERYSGQWRPGRPVLNRSYEDIEHRAIPAEDLLLFSERQYKNRADWNKNCPKKFMVFKPLDSQVPIDWLATHALKTGETVFIPAAYGMYNYPDPEHRAFIYADSNGCAAGLTREEAILQGLFEVVERDTLALAFGHKAPFVRVDLSGIRLPYFGEMEMYLASRERSLEVYRVPSELDIPCYIALSTCSRERNPILTGYGCHLDPVIAVSRAVTELGQTLFAETNEGVKQAIKDPYLDRKCQQVAWMRAYAHTVERVVDVKSRATLDVTEDVWLCVEMLHEKGLEVLVLDQTDPKIGCPVVKVIVPGMYHFWNRRGGRRMSEVPLSEGWAEGPVDEDDIEPIWFLV